MKKFLVVLTVLALLASSAFAAVTSVTKEMSQSNYPGTLTKGSVTGTGTFVADFPLLANTAMFEYIGAIYGLVALKTDVGTIGLTVAPSTAPAVTGISNPSLGTVGLNYAMDMDAMTLGAGLTLGLGSSSYENKDLVNNTTGLGGSGIDKANTTTAYIGIDVGAALKGSLALDLALGVAMDSSNINKKGYDNTATPANNVLRSDVTNDTSLLGIDAAGRLGLGNSILAVLGVTFNTATDKDTTLGYAALTGVKNAESVVTTTNNYLSIEALIGKDIKASDTLTVKMASGVGLTTDQSAKTVTKVTLPAPETTTYQTGTKWSSMNITVPINVAVEGKLNETWTMNAGIKATLLSSNGTSTKNNLVASTEDWKDYSTTGVLNITPGLSYTIGVTGKIGDLSMDLFMNPALLLSGPQFISGNTIPSYPGFGTNMNGAVAICYNWK